MRIAAAEDRNGEDIVREAWEAERTDERNAAGFFQEAGSRIGRNTNRRD